MSKKMQDPYGRNNKQYDAPRSARTRYGVLDSDKDEAIKPMLSELPARLTSEPARLSRNTTKSLMLSQEQIPIYASVNLVSLFSVDTVAETFTIRLNVTLVWPARVEGNIVGKDDVEEITTLVQGMDAKLLKWEPHWFPEYAIRDRVSMSEEVNNCVSILVKGDFFEKEDQWRAEIDAGKVTKDSFWLIRNHIHNATINKSQALFLFPLDTQELKVIVRLEHSSRRIRLNRIEDLPDEVRSRVPKHISVPELSFVANFKNLDTAEFHVLDEFAMSAKLSNDLFNRVHRYECGAAQISIYIKRQTGHYIWNVFMMVFLITSITFTAWAIDAEDVNNRLAMDVALLLTGQAFKLVIADKLPKVNYLTLIDVYILTCFGFIIGGIVMHAAVGWHGLRDEVDRELDHDLLWAWTGLWLSFNLIFIAGARQLVSRELYSLRHVAEKNGFECLSKEDASVESTSSGKFRLDG